MADVYEVEIKGIRPLLMHRYPIELPGERKREGEIDYSMEWLETCYRDNDELVVPAVAIERTLVKAAVRFKIKGMRGKTYKDLFNAAVFLAPDMIPLGIPVPTDPVYVRAGQDAVPTDARAYVDLRRVTVNRSAVVRARLAIATSWQLAFALECTSDQVPEEVINQVLNYAGETVGLLDFRPRFGRFIVTKFQKSER